MSADSSSDPSPSSPIQSMGRLWHFLRLSVAKARADNLDQQAAALSFTTLVSLIPLLASFSVFGARWFDQQQGHFIEQLAQLLPYSEEAIIGQLQVFLNEAQTIRGVGLVLFLVAALSVFTRIERTINRIWNIPGQRPFRRRLLSFTLVIFWGPIVIGATYYVLFSLRRQMTVPAFTESLSANLLPFIITLLGLTMLYWQVPYTTVRFRSALAGGTLAALLLELIRRGFHLYVDQAQSISLIYGSFGFALLFMISIQLTWWVILLGNEAAYCMQNFDFLTRAKRPAAPAEGSWLALLAMVLLTDRFRRGHPVTPHELLADALQIDSKPLRQALDPLVEEGLLSEITGDSEGYLLGRDPHTIQASDVFTLYEPLQEHLARLLPERLSPALLELRSQRLAGSGGSSESPSLADLAGVPDDAEAS